jgi:hypothetical protein
MKICRNYRLSTDPAPFLLMEGDLPATTALVVDMELREVYITITPRGLEVPDGLKSFPWEPCLTVQGIDQALSHPGLLEALQGVMDGRKEGEDYLWEVLGSSGFFDRLECVIPMDPRDYFEKYPFEPRCGEGAEQATSRVLEEALSSHIILDPMILEMEIEEALWD